MLQLQLLGSLCHGFFCSGIVVPVCLIQFQQHSTSYHALACNVFQASPICALPLKEKMLHIKTSLYVCSGYPSPIQFLIVSLQTSKCNFSFIYCIISFVLRGTFLSTHNIIISEDSGDILVFRPLPD